MKTNFENLPLNCIVYIMLFLDHKDIFSFRCTSKKNKRICYNKNVRQIFFFFPLLIFLNNQKISTQIWISKTRELFFCDPEAKLIPLSEEKKATKKQKKKIEEEEKTEEEKLYFENFVNLLQREELYKNAIKFVKLPYLEKIDNFCINSTHVFFAFSDGNISCFKIEDLLNSNFDSPIWEKESLGNKKKKKNFYILFLKLFYIFLNFLLFFSFQR